MTAAAALPPRSVVIPAEKEGVTVLNKSDSERIHMLNGNWHRTENGYETVFRPAPAARQRDILLHFDRPDVAFSVSLNGVVIGGSEYTKKSMEFDLTPAIQDGENKLCIGFSDPGDANNITDDLQNAYLIYQNRVCLWDYEITATDKTVSVVMIPNKTNNDLRAEVFFDRRTRKTELHEKSSVSFELPTSDTWCAEDPYLYDLTIHIFQGETETEVHTKKTGLRRSEINDGFFCVNGRPIVLHGIRYTKSPVRNAKQLRAELTFLKTCNFNAILAEQPQMPVFYELCSELGIYVADKAADGGDSFYPYHKNETCIVAWECASQADADALKNEKNAKPVFGTQTGTAFSDFRRYTTPSAALLAEISSSDSEIPAVVTSYDTNRQDLCALWDAADDCPQMQGAFADDPSDGTGCFSADGKTNPVLSEIKYHMSPIRIRRDGDRISLWCRNTFTRIDHCTLLWNLCEDTTVLNQGIETGLCFAPGETVRIPIPARVPENKKDGAVYRTNLMIFCGERDLGYAQFVLTEMPKQPVPASGLTYAPLKGGVDGGITVALPYTLKKVHWYGMGWQENDVGRNSSTLIGAYEGNADELLCGKRGCVRYAAFLDENDNGILFCGAPEFSFILHKESNGYRLTLSSGNNTSANGFIAVSSPYAGKEDALRRCRFSYTK